MRGPLFFLCFGIIKIVFSQTTLNAYAKVTTVTSSSVLALSNVNQTSHTFTVGGSVIVMQMQDDVIGSNTSNNSAFGDLSAISNAGKYEVAIIAARTPTSGTPTSVTLTSLLGNTYNTGSNSSVQLISYRNLGSNYTTTANISGLTWDGNVGGVVAFYVTNTLTLNHRVLADGLGFIGGSVSSNADEGCSNSFYRGNDANKGYKGEGIYKRTSNTYLNGRGKIINGGGGGSQNNSGGGGGGNYTSGGDGGLGWTCTSGNSGRGIGGLSLSTSISASRIFMGGGGGGGQHNNSAGTNGANGGGIILMSAKTISTSTTCGSSIRISANGNDATDSGNDGAGGGGAAGSIVIQATSFSVNGACPLTVRSNGGDGGNVTNSGVHGGGGGGGQGAVIYSSTQPTLNVTTQTNNGAPGADNSGGTTNATGGGGTSGTGIIASSSGPLPISLTYFKASIEQDKVKLQWQTASELNNKLFLIDRSGDGLEYTPIGSISGAGNSSSQKNYELYDLQPNTGINYYRLKQIDVDGAYKFYPILAVEMDKEIDFSIHPNPVGTDKNIIINLDKIDKAKITLAISDFAGKEFLNREFILNDSQVIELKDVRLEAGIYLIKLQKGNKTIIKKLIVQ